MNRLLTTLIPPIGVEFLCLCLAGASLVMLWYV